MDRTHTPAMRKRLMSEQDLRPPERRGEIDIASRATLAYSSEDPAHPIEHLIDGHCGRGGTHWASARANATERIVLEFDHPQQISCLVYEVEECWQERTQEVRVEVSSDHGRTYRQVLVQEYTFSPQGAIFQHEELRLELPAITHLSLTIVPNKSGSGVATLTALRLFA
jgi:F5/8 type C domain-containing protein